MATGATLNLCVVQGSGQRIRIRCRTAAGAVVADVEDWLFVVTIKNGDGDTVEQYLNADMTFDTSSGNSDAWVQITAAQTAALTADEDYTITILVTATGRQPWYLAGGVVTVQELPHDGQGEADITAYLDGPVVVDATETLPGTPGEAGAGVPTGGTVGQYLRKSSSTDYDAAWVTITGIDGGGA